MSFKVICCSGYHIDTDRKNEIEYLYIISTVSNEKRILEKLSTLSSGLYYQVIEKYATMNTKFMNSNIFVIWHNQLGYLGSIKQHNRMITRDHNFLI